MSAPERCALVVIDLQVGFDDPVWGLRNNPACESNVAALIGGWRAKGEPIVFVRHDSDEGPAEPWAPGQPGNALTGDPDLLVSKRVHSAFYGQSDLDIWLQSRDIKAVAICGIATDHCCETTARMAGALGYQRGFCTGRHPRFRQGRSPRGQGDCR
ncbi:MAG TPA: cysteine hydrolase family protein [Candidatus Saccharimonadales bacterium]|nr:cysteine hydrolase family protein [Candidatus Saccharimonadales bacterium]